MSLSKSYNKFAELMVDDVINKLRGSHDTFSRFESKDKPSRTIVLGTLSEENRDAYTESSGSQKSKSSVKNNSLSIKFLIKEENATLTVKPSLSVFYRVYPNFEEQVKYIDKKIGEITTETVDIAFIWKRKDLNFDEIVFNDYKNSEDELDFQEHINSIINDPEIYNGGTEVIYDSLNDETSYYAEIKNNQKGLIPNFNWKCQVEFSIEKFVQDNQELNLIEIKLVNMTKEDKKYENFLFNCKLQVDLGDAQLIPFKYDYVYEDHRRKYESFLRCLNSHADYNGNIINTEHFAEFKQKRKTPKIDIDGMKLKFEDLSKEKAVDILEELYYKMDNHFEQYKTSLNDSNPHYEDYLNNLTNFEVIKKRYHEGIETLKNNENALIAFKLMNETFLKNAKKFKNWRIFQVVFIVSIIPDIVDGTDERDICEVLHVMTGGGKSESYFGLVIFSAFWDRLSGKRFGVTAITKFPLRMLSIQQLQRIANLFIWAEKIRLDNKIDGMPFSVAYFVGNQTEDFPRHTSDVIPKIKEALENGEELPGKIIDKCPICDGKIRLNFEEEQEYIIHECTGEDCNRKFTLYYTDEEVYRYIPTFIVATNDKFAGIARNRRFKNLFGGKLDICPKHGFVARNDRCDLDKSICEEIHEKVDINFHTGPTLIIQDEMHLIKEGFGTIDSHFESLMEALQNKFGGNKFKNIAMTATITGAKEQIENLYQKRIRIFPGKLSDNLEDDFFFEYEKDQNGDISFQRKLIGLKPNLRDNQYASLLTLKYISEFMKLAEMNISDFSSKHNFEESELIKIIENYKNILTYHNKKNDVRTMNYYVEAVVNSQLDNYKIIPKILTGDNTLDYIKEIINSVNTYFDDPENDKDTLPAVFATSVVSHGVDIDKWNIMLFQGMPRSTAEYIQALSRVGRNYFGIVLLWFYPNRVRDLSFYQNFKEYHDIIDYKVETVPLARWAKLGFQQTITSIFNASILNYFSNLVEKPIYKVSDVNEYFSICENYMDNRKILMEFIEKAYISNPDITGVDYVKNNIKGEIEKRLNDLSTYDGTIGLNFFPNALENNKNKYYKTQLGMRGIQDEIVLRNSGSDINFLRKIMRQ